MYYDQTRKARYAGPTDQKATGEFANSITFRTALANAASCAPQERAFSGGFPICIAVLVSTLKI
jgi:hypothetical protein